MSLKIIFVLNWFFSNYLHVSWWVECNRNAANIFLSIEFQLCYDFSGSICNTNFSINVFSQHNQCSQCNMLHWLNLLLLTQDWMCSTFFTFVSNWRSKNLVSWNFFVNNQIIVIINVLLVRGKYCCFFINILFY
jgi:hypothetical protein